MTTAELCRAYFVFKACGVRSLVQSSGTLVHLAYKLLPGGVVDWFLSVTFFGHFCAGTDKNTIRPKIDRLHAAGVGGILDYAAEADLSSQNGKQGEPEYENSEEGVAGGSGDTSSLARVYDYSSEAACDANAAIFKDCIQAVHDVTPEGFAAIKVTALGNPVLLERMSNALVEIKRLFGRFESASGGGGGRKLSKEQFGEAWRSFFKNEKLGEQMYRQLDEDGDGCVDVIEWTNQLTLMQLTDLVTDCVHQGPLYRSALVREEQELMVKMMARVNALAEFAASLGVRLMIDAEQTYFQPAIDLVTRDLQRRFNKSDSPPTVFITYQCYLKDALERVSEDIMRARRHEYIFAAKVVRGAYMVGERGRAEEMGLESPVHDELKDTHACYHQVLVTIFDEIQREGSCAEIMVATHNSDSVTFAMEQMKARNIDPKTGGVYFGQLLGMKDNITFPLGQSGYNAYKYVPYGPVRETVPYLVRRAQENGDVLQSCMDEASLISSEMRHRLQPF